MADRVAYLMASNGGTQDSTQSPLRPLKYAVRDADRLANALTSRECDFDVRRPQADASSWDALLEFAQLAEACKRDDTLLCYFSGHGLLRKGMLYLLWHSSRESSLLSTAIPARQLMDIMSHSSARNRLLILDCCHAGAAVDHSGLKSGTLLDVREMVPDPQTFAVIMASSRLERARELVELEGSFLTEAIVRALTERLDDADHDGDRLVSLNDLKLWLEIEALKHNAAQPRAAVPIPFVFGRQTGDFLLTRRVRRPWTWPDFTGVEAARKDGIRGAGVSIWMMDSGCDAGHIEFRHTHIDFHNPGFRGDVFGYDPHGHGTFNCSVIAGSEIGIARDAQLSVLPCLDFRGTSTIADLVENVRRLLRHVSEVDVPTIVCFALASHRPSNELHEAIKSLAETGALILAPVGSFVALRMPNPAAYPEVVAVGGAAADLSMAESLPQTEPGTPPVDILGLSVNVTAAAPRSVAGENRYQELSGTSFAVAYVAGIAALYAGAEGLRGPDLRARLLASALPLPDSPTGPGLARFTA